MDRLQSTGTVGMPRAAARAVCAVCAAVITAGAMLSGCAASHDYVKPTETTAARTCANPCASEVAPQQPAGAAGAAENPVSEGTPGAED
ncbi:MAG: hypothetical protein QOI13_1931 [Paraburkholderia sp.]|jgi:hypothetical protein|nr:hypothetical protein [Paraburkholderia sp.]